MAQLSRETAIGPGRVLLAVYLVFVIAAGSRSVVQLATHPGRAPLAYALSLLASIVYAVGFTLVRRAGRDGGVGVHGSRRALRVCALLELSGVLAVGTASVVDPSAFPDATVWSYYGAGYLLAPLVLPVAALVWLKRGPETMAGCRDD